MQCFEQYRNISYFEYKYKKLNTKKLILSNVDKMLDIFKIQR